ncbi:hypothetical protein HK101_008912, partial [Irineochytrium annulatum]
PFNPPVNAAPMPTPLSNYKQTIDDDAALLELVMAQSAQEADDAARRMAERDQQDEEAVRAIMETTANEYGVIGNSSGAGGSGPARAGGGAGGEGTNGGSMEAITVGVGSLVVVQDAKGKGKAPEVDEGSGKGQAARDEVADGRVPEAISARSPRSISPSAVSPPSRARSPFLVADTARKLSSATRSQHPQATVAVPSVQEEQDRQRGRARLAAATRLVEMQAERERQLEAQLQSERDALALQKEWEREQLEELELRRREEEEENAALGLSVFSHGRSGHGGNPGAGPTSRISQWQQEMILAEAQGRLECPRTQDERERAVMMEQMRMQQGLAAANERAWGGGAAVDPEQARKRRQDEVLAAAQAGKALTRDEAMILREALLEQSRGQPPLPQQSVGRPSQPSAINTEAPLPAVPAETTPPLQRSTSLSMPQRRAASRQQTAGPLSPTNSRAELSAAAHMHAPRSAGPVSNSQWADHEPYRPPPTPTPSISKPPSPSIEPIEFCLRTPRRLAPYASLESTVGCAFMPGPGLPSFSILSNHALTLCTSTARFCAYYECTVLNADAARGTMAIGLATDPFPETTAPGWSPLSVSFLSTGERAHCTQAENAGTGNRSNFATVRYGTGDTIGCGYIPAIGCVFFTLNGEFLGEAFSLLGEEATAAAAAAAASGNLGKFVSDMPPIPFHAAIGAISGSVEFRVNFGAERFLYMEAGGGDSSIESDAALAMMMMVMNQNQNASSRGGVRRSHGDTRPINGPRPLVPTPQALARLNDGSLTDAAPASARAPVTKIAPLAWVRKKTPVASPSLTRPASPGGTSMLDSFLRKGNKQGKENKLWGRPSANAPGLPGVGDGTSSVGSQNNVHTLGVGYHQLAMAQQQHHHHQGYDDSIGITSAPSNMYGGYTAEPQSAYVGHDAYGSAGYHNAYFTSTVAGQQNAMAAGSMGRSHSHSDRIPSHDPQVASPSSAPGAVQPIHQGPLPTVYPDPNGWWGPQSAQPQLTQPQHPHLLYPASPASPTSGRTSTDRRKGGAEQQRPY